MQKSFIPWSKKLDDAKAKVDEQKSEYDLLNSKVCVTIILDISERVLTLY